KHKINTKTQFIDASNFYTKQTNNNVLENKHIEQIIKVFDSKENIEHFAKCVDNELIEQNDYNLSVSSYVEAKDTKEKVDIKSLNTELKTIVAKINNLRSEIDKII